MNGVISAPEDARVSAVDHGVLYGDGAFETLRTYSGVPFRLTEHLGRLTQTLDALGIPVPPELVSETLRTLEESRLHDAHVRITVTRGVGTRGWDPAGCEHPTWIISALPLRLPPESAYANGIKAGLLWSRGLQDLPSPEWKSTSYQRSILARRECTRRGVQEGIFLDPDGNVLEGASSNLFTVKNRVLHTPAQGCLPGITRAEVLRLARELGISTEMAAITREQLLEAEEVFVTSSIAELLPVIEVEGVRIGEGAPGPVTRKLHEAYRASVLTSVQEGLRNSGPKQGTSFPKVFNEGHHS